MDVYNLIMGIFCCLFWTLAYIFIIYRGFKDKISGMPFMALFLNISWEFIYAFIYPPVMISSKYSHLFRIIWFAFDVIIFIQFIMYWKKDFKNASKKIFLPFFAILFITCFLFVLFTHQDFSMYEMGDSWDTYKIYASFFTAFLMSLIMSILFIFMLHKRQSVAGQSVYIAICKMLGNLGGALFFINYIGLAADIGAGVGIKEHIWPYFIIAGFVFDVIYIIAVIRQCRKQNINPWKRL